MLPVNGKSGNCFELDDTSSVMGIGYQLPVIIRTRTNGQVRTSLPSWLALWSTLFSSDAYALWFIQGKYFQGFKVVLSVERVSLDESARESRLSLD